MPTRETRRDPTIMSGGPAVGGIPGRRRLRLAEVTASGDCQCVPCIPDRSGDHPEWHLRGFASMLQADDYAGCNSPPVTTAGRRAPGYLHTPPGSPTHTSVSWNARERSIDLRCS